MKIALGGRAFPSKKALTEHVRSLIKSPLGAPILGDDLAFLVALFAQHHRADVKFGSGVSEVFVMIAPGWSSRCFAIRRSDGTVVEISFLECLNPTSPERRFREACRHAIVDQLMEFKSQVFREHVEISCPVNGEKIRFASCHVDHFPTSFETLVQRFIAKHAIVVSTIDYLGWEAMETRMRFKDPQLCNVWSSFHKSNATLRATSVAGNLGNGRPDGGGE